jgi:hypothetical protein
MIINVSIAGKTFAVKLDDLHARPIKAEVDGEVFEVWPEEAAAATSRKRACRAGYCCQAGSQRGCTAGCPWRAGS